MNATETKCDFCGCEIRPGERSVRAIDRSGEELRQRIGHEVCVSAVAKSLAPSGRDWPCERIDEAVRAGIQSGSFEDSRQVGTTDGLRPLQARHSKRIAPPWEDEVVTVKQVPASVVCATLVTGMGALLALVLLMTMR